MSQTAAFIALGTLLFVSVPLWFGWCVRQMRLSYLRATYDFFLEINYNQSQSQKENEDGIASGKEQAAESVREEVGE